MRLSVCLYVSSVVCVYVFDKHDVCDSYIQCFYVVDGSRCTKEIIQEIRSRYVHSTVFMLYYKGCNVPSLIHIHDIVNPTLCTLDGTELEQH